MFTWNYFQLRINADLVDYMCTDGGTFQPLVDFQSFCEANRINVKL